MQVASILFGLILCALTASGGADELRDQFRMSDYQLSFDERLRIELAAPVIVVGRVLEVTRLGKAGYSPGDSRINTQLVVIRIWVEEAIKGTTSANPLAFYFFEYSVENDRDLGVPRYIPEAGQHRIFFLKPWQQTYRSVGDVTNFNLTVSSGTHPRGFCQGKEPGCCIAEILLVPSTGLNVGWFVNELGRAAYAAGIGCSPERARELLKQLSLSRDRRIADEANDAMSMIAQWWPQLRRTER